MKLAILNTEREKIKEKNKVALMVIQFVQEFNIDNENKYINFSLKNN